MPLAVPHCSIVTERAGWKQATTDEPQSEVPELYSFLDGIDNDKRQSVRPLASPRAALLRLGVTSEIKWHLKEKSETRLTASVLKRDPNT